MQLTGVRPQDERTGTDAAAVGRVTGVAVRLVADDRRVPVLHRLLVLLQHEQQSVGIAVAEMLVAVGTALGDSRIVDPARVRDEGVDRGDVVCPDGGVGCTTRERGRRGIRRRGSRHGDGDAREQRDDEAPANGGEWVDPDALGANVANPADRERAERHDDQSDRRNGGALADRVPDRAHPVVGARHQAVMCGGRTLE